MTFDPVCLFHGRRRSEHRCLVCCLCFADLTPDECWQDADGQRWDMHVECKRLDDEATAGKGQREEAAS